MANKNKILDSDGKPYEFAYDATVTKNHRRAPVYLSSSEDHHLDLGRRRKLVATTRDAQRNMSIAAWMIRCHLDYVSTFTFQAKTGIKELDRRIEELMEWYSRPLNCDIQGRFNLQKLIRTWEQLRTVDGDCFIAKLADGKLQTIEGDRVNNTNVKLPANFNIADFTDGIKTSPEGRLQQVIITDRDGSRFVYKTVLPGRFVHHFGYFSRIDQIRGVSPIAAGLNSFADVYEAETLALAKAKVSQYFGLKLKRGGEGGEGAEDAAGNYSIDFGQGPQLIDLQPGEDADFMESNSPAGSFQQFMQLMTQAALASLDIPYSFYSEDFTNFSGARQKLQQYQLSAEAKRKDLQELLRQITVWRLGLFIEDEDLQLPQGMRLSDIRFEWMPVGMPWIDPLKEVSADIAAVDAGLMSRQRILKKRGYDWYEIAEELQQEKEFIKEHGISEEEVNSKLNIKDITNELIKDAYKDDKDDKN